MRGLRKTKKRLYARDCVLQRTIYQLRNDLRSCSTDPRYLSSGHVQILRNERSYHRHKTGQKGVDSNGHCACEDEQNLLNGRREAFRAFSILALHHRRLAIGNRSILSHHSDFGRAQNGWRIGELLPKEHKKTERRFTRCERVEGKSIAQGAVKNPPPNKSS